MVLHLLGKKSWNVYNSENVERVRRDETAAQAREEAEELRMQEEDAAHRIAVLRGEPSPVVPQSAKASREPEEPRREFDVGRARKRRRLRGEDDTDRDIRYAKEDADAGDRAKRALVKRDNDDAPLLDHAGHLQLIPAPDDAALRKAEKNAEAEAEKAKKRQREEGQSNMRFSDAAGFKNGMEKPWYAASNTAAVTETAVALADKDVWGNEDPRRHERERGRISSGDPFAAMQQAQRQLKQSERDREQWTRERMAEVKELQHPHGHRRQHEKGTRTRDNNDETSLDGFSLDTPHEKGRRERSDHDRHRRRHHRHHGGRNRSRDKHKTSKGG